MTDVGAYCRAVEAHLTQVNGGHLVRIVGPSFDLVRRWAAEGVPLAVVKRGIDRKAERHDRGAASRPLRLEFCDADVRAAFDEWRRAIGVATVSEGAESETPAARRRPSLAAHLGRVVDRLGALTGRLEWPEGLRDGLEGLREQVAALQEPSRGARGEAREVYVSQLALLDRELLDLARRHAPPSLVDALRREAEADLAAYRSRLSAGDWGRSLDATLVRLLRDRLGLPTIEILP